MAQEFLLYSSLQEAWESAALSFKELWEMQDALLLSNEQWTEVRPQLERVAESASDVACGDLEVPLSDLYIGDTLDATFALDEDSG